MESWEKLHKADKLHGIKLISCERNQMMEGRAEDCCLFAQPLRKELSCANLVDW